MLIDIFAIVAVLGAIATVAFTPCAWYWVLLLALGYFWGLIFVHLLIALIVTLFIDTTKPVEGKVRRYFKFMVLHTVDGVLKVARVRIRLEGKQLIPTDRRFMLVSNHLSRFDPMVSMVALKRTPLAFVSKPENFKIPIAGPYVHKCKFLSIDRENPRSAITTLNTCVEYIKSGELSMGIYPEGTRSLTGELGEFHDGVFKIARDTKAPIVIMTLHGTQNIAKNFPLRSTRVDMKIVRVIEPEEFSGMRTGAISSMVREVMEQELNK
ncbi:MAG: 1-acyl-sn-glycerol-3-phosphate acyltransferase [Clostridia bacterium]|nr:1-acyl-sn-glycerol-3-phosphate acyltransferase [Clostridia bacterium]